MLDRFLMGFKYIYYSFDEWLDLMFDDYRKYDNLAFSRNRLNFYCYLGRTTQDANKVKYDLV